MKTYEGVLTLIEELKGYMDELERLRDLNKRAWVRIENGADDVLDFLRISKFFENSLHPDSWHKNLVERMALDFPELHREYCEKLKTIAEKL